MTEEHEQGPAKVEALQKKLQFVAHQNDKLKQVYGVLLQQKLSSNKRSTKQIWNKVQCRKNPDYVKSVIRDKSLNMSDMNNLQRTLLLEAAFSGSFEITQLCLNLGANIEHTDKYNKTAVDLARQCKWYHIEELLLFHQNKSVFEEADARRLKEASNKMKQQNGIIANIVRQLSNYDDITRHFFQDTLIDLMSNIIASKLSFSDLLLNLCLEFEQIQKHEKREEIKETERTPSPPKSNSLWQTILETCNEIIQSDNDKDWHWLKTFIVPSTIWFKRIFIAEPDKASDTTSNQPESMLDENLNSKETVSMQMAKRPNYLHQTLLHFVRKPAMNILSKLENDMNFMINSTKSLWTSLTQFQMTDNDEAPLRQDIIPNGVKVDDSIYEERNLEGILCADFHGWKFYDCTQYLGELVLVAHSVDDEFQQSIQRVFAIDTHTNMAGFGNVRNSLQYVRREVKQMEKARVEVDSAAYSNEIFPRCAALLDINSASLVFDDVLLLLNGLKLLRQKVQEQECGNITKIVGMENGFKEYDTNDIIYADIRVYVMIHDANSGHNIIGEIQFILRTMHEFKQYGHDLCVITKQIEFVENAFGSNLLHFLLDDQKALYIAVNMNDCNALLDLLVVSNKTDANLMEIDEILRDSILTNIVLLKNYKVFKLLLSTHIMDPDLLIECLFTANRFNGKPIGEMMQTWPLHMIQELFLYSGYIGERLKEKFQQNTDELFRLMWRLWSNRDAKVIDFVMKELNLQQESMIALMYYKHSKPKYVYTFSGGCLRFEYYSILTRIVGINHLEILKKLVSIIGEKEFVNLVFIPNGNNINAIEKCIQINKLEHLKYLMSFNGIKNWYIVDKHELYRIFLWIYMSQNDIIFEYLRNILNITDEQIVKFLDSPKYAQNIDGFAKDCWAYHKYSVLDRIIWNNRSLKRLKHFVSIIGKTLFVKHVFIHNGFNMNPIHYAIKSKHMKIIEYIMSFSEIRVKCMKNQLILFNIIWWMIQISDASINGYLIRVLKLTHEKLKKLQTFQYAKPIDDQYDELAVKYWNKQISDHDIQKLLPSDGDAVRRSSKRLSTFL